MNTTQHTDADTRTMELSRIIDAPAELVFEAWTKPEHVVQWWGPDGFTTTLQEMDVRPGGLWRFVMHGPDGTDYTNRVEYIEVDAPHKLVYWHGSDMDNDPRKFLATVTFESLGNQTRVTNKLQMNSREQYDESLAFGAMELGLQTLKNLADFVGNM